jgi:hypothetical protein
MTKATDQQQLFRSEDLEKALCRIELLIVRAREATETRPDVYGYFELAEIYETAARACDNMNAGYRCPEGVERVETAHDNLVAAIEWARAETRGGSRV